MTINLNLSNSAGIPGGLYFGDLPDVAALTAISATTLTQAVKYRVGLIEYTWDADATAGALEPDDKANPGVDPGYWMEATADPVPNSPNTPGATLPPVAVADLPTGGDIGTAVDTVDANSAFVVTQTTVGQTITLPAPADPTGARLVTVLNDDASTTSFTLYGTVLEAGRGVEVLWDGAAWVSLSSNPTTTELSRAQFTLSANQTANLVEGDHVSWSTTALLEGSKIALDITTPYTNAANAPSRGRFTLQPGKYAIKANVSCTLAQNNGWIFCTVWDVEAGVALGGTDGGTTANPGIGGASTSAQITVVGAPRRYEIRFLHQNGVTAIHSNASAVGRSNLEIIELPTAVAPVVNTVAEYGETVLGSNINVPPASSSAVSATDILAFTLPSAGVWEVDYTVRAITPTFSSLNSVGIVVLLTDSANSVVLNSEIQPTRNSTGTETGTGNQLALSASGVVRITTTGPATYKLRGHHDGTSVSANWAALSDSNGRTKISYKKIAGFLPAVTTPVNDQTISGEYIDIGDMRMAWGKSASVSDDDTIIPYGVTFAAVPIVTATLEITNAGTASPTVGRPTSAIKFVTATGFTFNRDDTVDAADQPLVNWVAIGQKV